MHLFPPQGTRMEGYADPSTAAQDAMVNIVRCEHLKHKLNKPTKQTKENING